MRIVPVSKIDKDSDRRLTGEIFFTVAAKIKKREGK